MRRYLLGLLVIATSTVWPKDIYPAGNQLLVVVGMLKEAKYASPNVNLLISGANSERLEKALMKQDMGNVRAIISYGVAGGLNPEYRPGDVVIPYLVVTDSRRLRTDARLSSQFAGQLLGQNLRVRDGVIVGSNRVIMTPQDKQMLYKRMGADLVDMESHIAAEFAAQHNLPFVAIRVISDPSERALPGITRNAITWSGQVRVWSIVGKLLLQPWQLPNLIRAGRDSSIAFAALKKCQALLEPPTELQPAE